MQELGEEKNSKDEFVLGKYYYGFSGYGVDPNKLTGGGTQMYDGFPRTFNSIEDTLTSLGNACYKGGTTQLRRHNQEGDTGKTWPIVYRSLDESKSNSNETNLPMELGCHDCFFIYQTNGKNLPFEKFVEKFEEFLKRFPGWEVQKDTTTPKKTENPAPQEEKDKPREEEMREMLKTQLQNYIERIEGYLDEKNVTNDPNKGGGYQHGFWVLAESRALNRQVNYALAKELCHDLEMDNGSRSIADVFSNYENKREKIVNTLGLHKNPNYAARGINSSELNAIIETAKNYTSSHQNELPKPN